MYIYFFLFSYVNMSCLMMNVFFRSISFFVSVLFISVHNYFVFQWFIILFTCNLEYAIIMNYDSFD